MDKKIINNQPSLNPKVGSYGKHGSVAANACGAIAINNVCALEDKSDITLDTIIQKNLSQTCGVILGGALGTNPLQIKKLLEEYGFKVTYLGNFKSIKQVKPYKYFIVLYGWQVKTQIGAHYQAGRIMEDNTMELFNPYRQYKSVDEFKKNEKAICPVVYGINS